MRSAVRRMLLAGCALLLTAVPLAARDTVPNPDLRLGRTETPAPDTRDDNILVQGFEPRRSRPRDGSAST